MTEEHVIANWVRRLLGEQRPANHTLYAPGKQLHRFPRLPYTLTARVACAPCNNGWMNDLEMGVSPHLANAIKGEGGWILDASAHETIAAWAAKTAMVLEWVGDAKLPLIPTAHYRDLLERKTTPPDGTSVWIAAYGGTRFETLCARNAISVAETPDELERLDQSNPHFYLSTVAIRHLVVHLCGTRRDGAVYRAGFAGTAFRRIYPSTGSFQWPPGPPLTDQGLADFVNL